MCKTQTTPVCLNQAQKELLNLLQPYDVQIYIDALEFIADDSLFNSSLDLDKEERTHYFRVKELRKAIIELQKSETVNEFYDKPTYTFVEVDRIS